MKISLCKNSYVISCDKDRYDLFLKIFNYYNIPQPILFDACISAYDKGVYGCLFSHYSLYKIAQTLNLPYLIVFEDDIFPRKDIIDYFNNAIKNVPDNWSFLKIEDVFFNRYENKKYYNEYWFSGKMCGRRGSASAAYIMNRNIYEIIINEIEKSTFGLKLPIDYIFQRSLMSIDGYYISTVPMFLQHNIHNKKVIHQKNNFKNGARIVHAIEEDMKNFKIDEWL